MLSNCTAGVLKFTLILGIFAVVVHVFVSTIECTAHLIIPYKCGERCSFLWSPGLLPIHADNKNKTNKYLLVAISLVVLFKILDFFL